MVKTNRRGVSFKLVPSNLEVIIGKASVDRIDDVPLIDVDYKLHHHWYRLAKRALDISLAGFALLISSPILLYSRIIARRPLRRREILGRRGQKVVIHRFESGNGTSWWMALPTLWAVVLGRVSLVGSEMRDAEEGPESWLGAELKPGLTGINQIQSGRQLSEEEKERQDLYYLKNYSPMLDLEILFKSVFKI
jgi:lipopolysaccharide/colanic/teichoic acid biosynthesis glycosyltransferase